MQDQCQQFSLALPMPCQILFAPFPAAVFEQELTAGFAEIAEVS